MRLHEIQNGTAEEQRVKRLKGTANAARDKAKQLKAQANVSAAQLKMNKSKQDLSQARTASVQAWPPLSRPHA